MDTIDALKTRRSVRTYTDQAISGAVLRELVDCAHLAPTAMNLQPWEFVVITKKETLWAIASLIEYGRFIGDAPACIAVLARDTAYYLEDASAATTNILLAAHASGLGACWVAGDKQSYAARVCEMLKAPEGYRLVSLVAVGYAAEQPKVEKRALDDVLHWGSFGER